MRVTRHCELNIVVEHLSRFQISLNVYETNKASTSYMLSEGLVVALICCNSSLIVSNML
jgi:hypothetical protein